LKTFGKILLDPMVTLKIMFASIKVCITKK